MRKIKGEEKETEKERLVYVKIEVRCVISKERKCRIFIYCSLPFNYTDFSARYSYKKY